MSWFLLNKINQFKKFCAKATKKQSKIRDIAPVETSFCATEPMALKCAIVYRSLLTFCIFLKGFWTNLIVIKCVSSYIYSVLYQVCVFGLSANEDGRSPPQPLNGFWWNLILIKYYMPCIYVGLQCVMGTLTCDGHAKVRWFALKCDGVPYKE